METLKQEAIMINKTLIIPSSILLCICFALAPAMMAAVELKQDNQSGQIILSNDIVTVAFNMSNGTYTITDKTTGQLMVDQAGVAGDSG